MRFVAEKRDAPPKPGEVWAESDGLKYLIVGGGVTGASPLYAMAVNPDPTGSLTIIRPAVLALTSLKLESKVGELK